MYGGYVCVFCARRVYACACARMRACTSRYAQMHALYVRLSTNLCVYIYMYIYMYIYVCVVHMCMSCSNMNNVYVCACVRVCARACVCACVLVRVCVRVWSGIVRKEVAWQAARDDNLAALQTLLSEAPLAVYNHNPLASTGRSYCVHVCMHACMRVYVCMYVCRVGSVCLYVCM